ncbi:class II aldolase/adducin family protein [Christensenella tenuis]|jgi:ribulose-5-phosphate 4-epimerase/fuculose-1-phosphate aldolase|uniref:Class II aldolase/adducin family protein n=1 Tax=Christensenella tenuis TaxID=2763033 RepID=A0ABR7EHJ8_9FIRM|nr:class II aldolase/adducin family protein [Christensenella tenuis]MBC5649247.1 class II aldolase/adducin family protein [Christensenella tenuis]
MCNFGNDYMRCKMINTGRLMFDRQLTDAGGGNISVRHNGLIYVTPMMAGEKLRWQLQPDDLIALDENTLEVVENDPTMMTRESMMHLGIYEAIPSVGAVLHAHPRYCLVYAAAKKRLDVYTENFEYFAGGPMECVKEVEGTSPELAKEVISYFYNRRSEIPERALGALIPNHGIVIAAKDLDEAFTLLDNAEVNAMVGLFQKLL